MLVGDGTAVLVGRAVGVFVGRGVSVGTGVLVGPASVGVAVGSSGVRVAVGVTVASGVGVTVGQMPSQMLPIRTSVVTPGMSSVAGSLAWVRSVDASICPAAASDLI